MDDQILEIVRALELFAEMADSGEITFSQMHREMMALGASDELATERIRKMEFATGKTLRP